MEHAEAKHAEKLACVCGDRTRTFKEFVDRCRRVGSVLEQLGVDSGDRVGLLAPNSDIYAELYCGIPAAGRAIVPLNGRWAEPELAYALDDAGAKLLITDQESGGLAQSVDQVITLTSTSSFFQTVHPKSLLTLAKTILQGSSIPVARLAKARVSCSAIGTS